MNVLGLVQECDGAGERDPILAGGGDLRGVQMCGGWTGGGSSGPGRLQSRTQVETRRVATLRPVVIGVQDPAL